MVEHLLAPVMATAALLAWVAWVVWAQNREADFHLFSVTAVALLKASDRASLWIPMALHFKDPWGGYCTDCTVLAAQIDIVFENGTRADIANGFYLHHMTSVTTSNSTGKDSSSWVDFYPKSNKAGSQPGLISLLGSLDLGGLAGGGFVGGAVDEFVDYFTTIDGKVNSGYFIAANSRAFVSYEVINYLREPQTFYIRLDLEWLPGKQGVEGIKTPLSVEGNVCPSIVGAFC